MTLDPDTMLMVADDIVDTELFEVLCEIHPPLLDSARRVTEELKARRQ